MTLSPDQVLLAVWLLGIVVFALRIGPIGQKEHLRNPNGNRIAAFWNILDSTKWTDEGLVHHRRWLRFMGCVLLSLVPLNILSRLLRP